MSVRQNLYGLSEGALFGRPYPVSQGPPSGPQFGLKRAPSMAPSTAQWGFLAGVVP